MMNYIQNPKIEEWKALSKRPIFDVSSLDAIVRPIFNEVKENGDAALKKFTKTFDRVSLDTFLVSESEIEKAIQNTPLDLQEAILLAKSNIEKFHQSQIEIVQKTETQTGVQCWRESRPIKKVGLYIPGGSAPLFSTVLMLGVPAKIAGCEEIVLCTPPDAFGNINPAILFTAQLVGIKSIYKIGGAQAIAAFTFGTESIPKVDKIFGPGNQYVTSAKQLAQNFGVAIDMPAGPSELLVIADETANPAFVASDLLSQAEHGADSQVLLVSNSNELILNTLEEIKNQLSDLPRQEIALKALENSRALLFQTLDACVDFSNQYAPEHLILATANYAVLKDKITTAGSVFLGNYSPESAGDYASGTNHTLPTNGFARNYSGVSLDSFVKKITFQEISKQGLQKIGKAVEIMANAEQLFAHKNAVTIRLKSIENE